MSADVTPAVSARLASAADAALLWRWRNDSDTRLNSFNQEPIPWPTHQTWLERRLADPNVRLYIVEVPGAVEVAHVRFERCGDDAAEVHVMVAPEQRSRGYGSAALRCTVPLAMAALSVGRIEALVKPDNAASVHAFERSGFQPSAASGDDGVRRFEYVQQ